MAQAARRDNFEEFEEVSKITEKGQTTVPASVRKALGVDKGGKITFRVGSEGISVRRAEAEHSDPVVGTFLSFLAKDLSDHPETLGSFSPSLVARINELVGDIEIDTDATIEGDVDL